MDIILYEEKYEMEESLDNFLTALYSTQLKYLASDLLNEGLTSRDISMAIRRAMTIGKASGLEVRQHFLPVYTRIQYGIIQDCKLSKLGYAMILLNARPELPVVAKWQLNLLKKYFSEEKITL